MKIVAKKDRKLLLINTGNTQNENKAETIELTVPEEYEDYNKKIVFVTDDGIVWDIIQDNTYKLTKAITKYKQVDFYIWLTKDDVDFRSKTMPLRFYHNEDASDEITPEEIHGVNTVVNILEEEITKVDSLETELRALITDIQNKLDNGEFDGKDGYTPQKGIDYFTEQDIEEIETDVKNDLEENVLVNYSLIAETGAKIELSINTTDYKLKAILKDKNNNIIHTSNVIDLPLETMVVNATYDNVNKAIILTLQNGTTVSISVADLVSGLVSESQLQTILSNYYTKTEINNLLNNKVDKVQGKELSSNDFTDTLKEKLEGLENYDDTEIKADISDIQEEQTEQNTDIEKLQEENARLKATLPTTTGEGKYVTLNKTAELEFIKPPLPMGNSEQESTTGKNLLQNKAISKTEKGITATKNEDGTVTLSGTATDTFAMDISGSCDLLAGTYIISGCPTGGSASTYRIMMWNSSWSYISQDIGNSGTFTLENDTTNNKISIQVYSGTTINNLVFKPMIRLASITDDTYEPYTNGASPNPDYPQEITNVTGDVEVKVQNKNRCKSIYETEDLRRYRRALYVDFDIKPNTQYAFSFNTNQNGSVFYPNENIFTNSGAITVSSSNRNIFIGTTKNLKDLSNTDHTSNGYAIFKNNIDLSVAATFEDVQIEENTVATDYVEHKEQTLPLTLGNIELCKIGDYQDYFYKESNKWYLHKEIEKVVLDGTQTGLRAPATEGYRFCIDLNGKAITSSVSEIAKLYSNKFKGISRDNSYSNIQGIAFSDSAKNYKDLIIYCEDTKNMTFAEFQTWLSNNNTEVYYPLITPTDTQITDTTLISQLEAINNALSYEEQTNILSNTIALFKVEAYQSTKLVLKEMATAIVALGGV